MVKNNPAKINVKDRIVGIRIKTPQALLVESIKLWKLERRNL